MSLATVDLNKFASGIRRALQIFRGRKIGNDTVSVTLPKKIVLTIEDLGSHIHVTWEPVLEADIPGPVNPDLLALRIFDTYTLADLRLSNIRIEH